MRLSYVQNLNVGFNPRIRNYKKAVFRCIKNVDSADSIPMGSIASAFPISPNYGRTGNQERDFNCCVE